MITTDEMRILLSINGAASYTTTINEITNVTKNYDKSVGHLISTLAKLVSAGALIKFGKQCIQAASDLEEVQNVVDVTFGAMSKDVDDWAKTNAASFGLSEKAAKEYASRFGNMAKQFGMNTKQAVAMGEALASLSGDVASFYNITDSAAYTKLRAIFSGETEGLKELGVVMTQAQLDAYAMQKGWGKTTDKMTEQEKVVLRYQFTLEKLAHAQGDFARTSDSYANSLRTFKLDLQNYMAEIGKELLPVAAQGIQAIGSIVKAVAPTVISIAKTIRLYAQAWKNASERTKTFAKIALIAIGVMLIIPKVISTISKAFTILTTKAVTATMAIQALVGIIGILFAIAALSELSKEVEKLRQEEAALGDTAEIGTEAIDGLSESLDGLGDSTKGLETFLASFDEVNKVGGGNSLMSSLINSEDLDNILGAIDGIDNLQSQVSDFQNQLNSVHLPSILPEGIFTKEFWAGLGEGIMGFLEETFFHHDDFWEDWKQGFDMIVEGIQSVGEWLEKVAPKWSEFWGSKGKLYDATHTESGAPKTVGALALDMLLDDNGKDNSESFTAANGVTYAKYKSDGTLSSAYENYIRGNANKTANQTVNNTTQNQTIDITLLMDGRKMASVVTDLQNQKAKSSGNSPLTN